MLHPCYTILIQFGCKSDEENIAHHTRVRKNVSQIWRSTTVLSNIQPSVLCGIGNVDALPFSDNHVGHFANPQRSFSPRSSRSFTHLKKSSTLTIFCLIWDLNFCVCQGTSHCIGLPRGLFWCRFFLIQVGMHNLLVIDDNKKSSNKQNEIFLIG